MNNQSSIDRSISSSEQQHFLFITLAHNRVRVLYEYGECQYKREEEESGRKRSLPELKLTDIYTHIHIVYIDSQR